MVKETCQIICKRLLFTCIPFLIITFILFDGRTKDKSKGEIGPPPPCLTPLSTQGRGVATPLFIIQLKIFVSNGSIHLMNFKLLLAVLKTKCKSFGNRAFNKASHLLWNSLPNSIRHLTDLQKIQKRAQNFSF